jgi:hypothetical protein
LTAAAPIPFAAPRATPLGSPEETPMRPWFLSALVAAATLTCGAALAEPDYPMDKPGKWKVTFQAPQPVTGTLVIDVLESYVAESVETGKPVSYGDASTYHYFDFNAPITFGSAFVYVPQGFTLYYDSGAGPVREGHNFMGRADFFGNSRPVTIDYAYLGIVPEPATWALLILGFAAAGSALRRQASIRAA